MGADAPRFSILLPVHRPPALLPFAVRSVVGQARGDWELFIICDGAPEETVALAEKFAAEDERVRVRAHPKGERHGEVYRHLALQEAAGTWICQIADDDLWLPHHLDEMAALLEEADFGHVLHTEVDRAGSLSVIASDLASPIERQRMLEARYNTFGPTVCGYRASVYRALPEGWSPAPKGIWSDLFQWRKFLRAPGLVYQTRMAVTSLHFASPLREALTLAERAAENESWFARIDAPGFRREVEREVLGNLVRRSIEGDAKRALAREARAERRRARRAWKERWFGGVRRAWAAVRGAFRD